MTPAARIQTAGELLDAVLAGQAAEQALTRWARGNRYAGSKDRAAIRDLVFDALRRKRSYAALGGAETGRGLMLGALRASETAIDEVFTGARFMPAPVTEAERAAFRSPSEDEVRDLPDWLWPEFARSLGDAAEAEARLLRERAEVFLRVNLLKSNLDTAQARLSGEGIATEPHALSPTALRVTEGARRVHLSAAYGDGLVELQDAASQAVVDALAPQPGDRVLELFAGLGNFTLPLARRGVHIHAVEGDAGLVARARNNAVAQGLDGAISTEVADLFGDSAEWTWPGQAYDLALLDPPRAGAAECLAAVATSGVRRIVYVSCHPATLARDARRLVQEFGFTCTAAGVIDMFPHTAHVESMAVFSRGD